MSRPSLWAGGAWDDRFAVPSAAKDPSPRIRRRRRMPARPRPRIVDLLAAIAGLGLGITIALGVAAESSGSLHATGGVLTALGRMAGLVAAYSMVVVVVLIARFPPLERAIGQDRLVAWHRTLGPYPLFLLAAHAILITLGYAEAAHDGALHQFWTLITTYQWMLPALAGGVLLIAAGVSSYKRARRRVAYETWWTVHLYTYLALLLSFDHQVATGASFVGHTTATFWWTALWIGTLALVVGCRLLLPLWRSVRHQLEVEAVVRDSPSTVTLVLRGRRLDRLPIAGGQFLQWRFLQRGLWWQAHPYSISSAPSDDRLRITVKDLGDHSHRLASMRPGTRVAIEGPYGAFTPDHAASRRVVLIGAGVGTTPINALLDELPADTDVVTILRAHTEPSAILHREIGAAVERRGGRLYDLIGSRSKYPLTSRSLLAAIPDLAQRDVFVCGPQAFTESVAAELRAAGLSRRQIHFESFSF